MPAITLLPVRSRLPLATVCALTLLACSEEAEHATRPAPGFETKPGLPEHAAEAAPAPTIHWPVEPPVIDAEPTPSTPAQVEPDPELGERKQALANVGRAAFEALQANDFDALLTLTPIGADSMAEACPDLPTQSREELEARFEFCHEAIDWKKVAEAQMFAGEPTGEPTVGCREGIEDYGRLQMFVHMDDKKIWRVDFHGAVGEEGKAIGIDGAVSCREVDEAPPLR